MAKVSIVLTSYNHAKYLREAIDSVLGQTFGDFELIIWDDASTDESWLIIKSYTDARIRAFRNETRTHGGYFGKALSEVATADYVAIHHSDDLWERDKLERQVVFLDGNPRVGAVFTNATAIDEEGQALRDTSHFYYRRFDQPNRSRHEWLGFFFSDTNALCHPSVLIRRSCYDACGLYRYGLAQLPDFDMWVRLCLKYDIYVLPERLVRFRVRSNEANTSGNRLEARIRWEFEMLQVLDSYREIKSPEDFTRVFPTSRKYFGEKGFDIGFALGMVSLEPWTSNPAKLFGLQLLFEALNDPERAKKIKALYGFDHLDLMALTATHDVFSSVAINDLGARGQALTVRVSELKAKEEELGAIRRSKAWKLAQLLRLA